MNGYRSHILEHHSAPGGVAAAWRHGDYLVDGGIHFLMNHRPGSPTYELYRQLGAVQANRFLDMPTYGRFIDEETGRSIEVTPDLDRLSRDLKAFTPRDARTIDDLIAGARALQRAGVADVDIGRPPELTTFLDRLAQMWQMRGVLKYFGGLYARPVVEYVAGVRDPWLRRFIENLFLPEVPVWFVFMLLALLADGQMGLLEGGSLGFVTPIEKRYKDLGGQVTYSATVEEILVERDAAVGVRLADGSERRADVVVSAADGHSTIFDMLGGRYLDEKIKQRYAKWPLARPSVMISFGVARAFEGEPWLSMIHLAQPMVVGDQTVEALALRIFNYSDKFAPPGKTVIQASFETEWDSWNEVREDRPAYEREKERVAREVLARLEPHYPGISSQVEITDVATPYTTWRYTLNRNGAYIGWLATPEAIMTRVWRTLPGLANFYMAGQWVVPGGGVPPCLHSGRHVIEILCRRDRKPFVTAVP
jgi:phytoene desaturase